MAAELRIVTAGRLPVMELSGVSRELIGWTARRSDQIAACLSEREHEYVTAVDDDGGLRFLPVVSDRARVRLNRIARMPGASSRRTLGVWSMCRSWCTGSSRPAVGGS
ncbi:hypothetical protein OHU17_00800 [Streptomyces goshikiensis]|uniref:Uncharacterized protein n=1 Tax=Streptomyces goshikiensis TaxID=1942 RepID=A0ABZ1RWN5_9ACTN|nr:hypothetical protein [Streptomyces goshikiensis]